MRRADYSSRGVQPTAVRRCVNQEALAHWGLLRQKQTNQTKKPTLRISATTGHADYHIRFACTTALKMAELNPNTSAVQMHVLMALLSVGAHYTWFGSSVRCAVHKKALLYAYLFYAVLL